MGLVVSVGGSLTQVTVIVTVVELPPGVSV